eukprot:scaffold359_cov372-Pavlova_lutheri.AAC.9
MAGKDSVEPPPPNPHQPCALPSTAVGQQRSSQGGKEGTPNQARELPTKFHNTLNGTSFLDASPRLTACRVRHDPARVDRSFIRNPRVGEFHFQRLNHYECGGDGLQTNIDK